MSVRNPEKDLLLCYIVGGYEKSHIDKDTFLSSAAYIADGKIVDFMYDSFIFLSQPNYLYEWDERGAHLKGLDKANWLDFVTNEEFAPDMNINALDAAVGEAKKALSDSEYKANVFMTLFYPVSSVYEFGEVNGKNLNFANYDDRIEGLKWMVDESIRQFESKNYQNIRLAGFYWFCEEIDFHDDNEGLMNTITDYIRSRSLKTCWCPYFGAPGYKVWRELGVDIATHQANFFPDHHKDWPNCGGEERLAQVAQTVDEYGIGVGMEMGDEERLSVEVFKKYLKAGVEYGFMHSPHIYYMGHGPRVIKAVADSSDRFIRSVYDELHKYIHRTLEASDIYTE